MRKLDNINDTLEGSEFRVVVRKVLNIDFERKSMIKLCNQKFTRMMHILDDANEDQSE